MDIEINEELIKQVASNANLTLNEEEINNFESDFKEILSNFEKLSKAEVSDKPSFHPVPVKNKTRVDDTPKDGISHKTAMKNVKESSDGYIRGPKVV